jgi:PAS domain S-box-containing protein
VPTPSTDDDGYRLLVQEVKDYAIFMLDRKGRVLSWNAGAQRLKGYTPEEIIGKHFSVFYKKKDVANNKPQRELEIAQPKAESKTNAGVLGRTERGSGPTLSLPLRTTKRENFEALQRSLVT